MRRQGWRGSKQGMEAARSRRGGGLEVGVCAREAKRRRRARSAGSRDGAAARGKGRRGGSMGAGATGRGRWVDGKEDEGGFAGGDEMMVELKKIR